MEKGESPSEDVSLATFIAETLERQFGRDASLQAACAGLQRMGLSVTVRVAVAAGADGPRVLVEGRRKGVTQWTREDREILHSLGIAGNETGTTNPRPTTKPGRRQPR
jgi:hypothetical protein